MAMTDIVKKKTRRLKRSVRRTLGTLFLVSALVVAAIPTDGLRQVQADPANSAGYSSDLTWDKQIKAQDKSKIPLIDVNEQNIFTNEDGVFRFAYVRESADSSNYIAVILGYSAGNLTNNALTIPDTVDAYAKYQKNDGSNGGYVAVSQSREPLYYIATEREELLDVSGNGTGEFTDPVLMPCSREDRNWDRAAALNTFYYRDDNATANDATAAVGTAYKLKDGSVYVRTDEETHQWIRKQTVAYIGNQYLTAYTGGTTSMDNGKVVREWVVAEGTVNTDESKGVFAGNNNIVRLTIGENLKGIGNYAFYSCANLEYVKFGNGLEEVGKYAFANCTNMTEIGIDFTSNLTYISDYTFWNCRSLRSFAVPSGVTAIYDHAFEGCTDLGRTSLGGVLDLTGSAQGKKVNLEKIGYSVFKNCTGLAEVIFPEAIDNSADVIDVNNFEGCSSLLHVGALSPYTSFGASQSDFTVEDFKEDVPETIYFEAAGTSETHEFTKKNAIAFKYSDRDLYEIIMQEIKVDANGNRIQTGTDSEGNPIYETTEVMYQVNSSNELINFTMQDRVAEVQIPTAIGPYGVSAINSGCFSANCYLKKITIPATVTRINEGAFKGCHNLEDVIFANAGSVQYIGQDAFATQVVNLHSKGCPTESTYLNAKPKLTFTGTVGTGIVPFDYAMSASSYINATTQGSQPKTFITYYSGWPTNLEIQYEENPVTGSGAATLVGYPSFTKLTGGEYTKANYPYITDDLGTAALEAVQAYLTWLTNPATEVAANQWEIIRASLNPVIPQGVKAVTSGLFNGATVTDDGNGGYDVTRATGSYADTDIQTITFEDLAEYTPYMFDGCTALTTISITGGTAKMDDYAFALKDTTYTDKNGLTNSYKLSTFNMSAGGSEVGNYAFDNNQNLTNVLISPSVTTMGRRPFSNCPKLQTVDFGGGPYFVTDRSIIYGLKDGYKDSIVQCLESRGSFGTAGTVAASELVGITSMAEEAFMDCNEIGTVDLSESSISNVPVNAFRNTGSLYNVSLPTTCRSISKDAFYNSNLRYLAIPNSVSIIDQCAFNTTTYPVDSSDPDYVYPGYKTIEFYCEEDSAAAWYANEYENILITQAPPSTTFKVNFWVQDEDGLPTIRFVDEQIVPLGGSATLPVLTPTREGYVFTGWYPSDVTNVSKDIDCIAQWRTIDSSEVKTTVEFVDWDDSIIYTQRVTPGEDCIVPQSPTREGYTFTGWRPAITNIPTVMEGTTYKTYAQYEKISDGGNSGSDSGSGSGSGSSDSGSGSSSGSGSGSSDSGSGSSSSSGSDNGNNGGTTNATLYTLTVQNGSGSGSYVAGSQPIVIANDPAAGQEFSHWTIDPASTPLASAVLSATVITMPASNVTVTAHYRAAGSGTGTGNTSGNKTTGTGNSSSSNTNRPSGSTGTVKNTGTTVVIDKNGLSNTGVVQAVVNGSSDNFVIKISESSAATEAIIRALMAEYGNDISNIKYFPMDITLYDSTGTNKITDTTGLSVKITLPLPDSLITYAGNNKVAGVVNDRLDKLSPKFTTINGVSCVTFTAEHFSPYVIYVDTTRLSDGTVADSTPKTGDGIHPKWFLSVGLACLSFVMFMQRDSRRKEKVKVKARV